MHLRLNFRLIIILFFSVFSFSYSLFAQEILSFVSENDIIAYDSRENELVINAGAIIKTNSEVGYISKSSTTFHLGIYFEYFNTEYKIFAKGFHPLNTIDVFYNDIFIDYPMDIYNINSRQLVGPSINIGDVDEMWVPVYYYDVLRSQNLDSLIKIIPALLSLHENNHGENIFWYQNQRADIQHGRAMFYNSVIKLGEGTHFAVKNIKKTNYGYIVDCVSSPIDGRYQIDKIFPESIFWDMYDPGDSLTLFLYLDGDYLDIYADRNEILLGTFVKVKREFIKQYQSLIKTNTCDLTNVIWPSRKDGSRHFTLPIEETADNIDSHENVMVQDNGEKNFLPLPLLLAIISGVAVVAGAVVVLLRKKK